MSFKKLALVTAMFAATSGAFAMEAMDEESLAATTGQDGITIGLSTQANLDIIIHDNDGLGAVSLAPNSGAIIIEGLSINGDVGETAVGAMDGRAAIAIDIDAGSSAAAAADATLNIGISTGAMRVNLGTLSVANSDREGGIGWGFDAASQSTVLNLGTVDVTGVSMNIQLGDQPQGNLIAMNTTLTGGLSLSAVSLNDTVNGGSISVGNLLVTNAGGGDLDIDLGIDATLSGLAVTVNTLGTGGMDVLMTAVDIGGAGNIGDVEIRGLNMTGDVITISGH